jgi:hypothetical protein
LQAFLPRDARAAQHERPLSRSSYPEMIPSMPTNTSPHKFCVGQQVEFLPDESDHNIPRGGYVITRALPGDDFDRSYRARSRQDGLERVFREPQLRASVLAPTS